MLLVESSPATIWRPSKIKDHLDHTEIVLRSHQSSGSGPEHADDNLAASIPKLKESVFSRLI